MSLHREQKLITTALLEGNVIAARLAKTIQDAPEGYQDHLAFTNGKLIYATQRFWDLPVIDQYFVLNHEFLHIILKHAERGVGKNQAIYNIAADIVINDMLFRRKRRTNLEGLCTYESYDVPRELETTQEVYDYLLDQACEDFVNNYSDLFPEIAGDNEALEKVVEKLTEQALYKDYSKQAVAEKIVPVPQDFAEKPSWVELLTSEIGRLAIRANIRTFKRPSRVKIPGCVLKGGYIYQYIPKINVIIDVSSSMGNMPVEIAKKINAARSYLKVFKPEYYWLNTSHGKIDKIDEMPLGGGTDLSQVTRISGADMNILLTDCEDENGINEINNSPDRFMVITTNNSSGFVETPTHKLIKIASF